MVLGAETDTQDKDGKVISRSESSDKPSREEIETAFARFTGRQRQVPPMVSAKSYRGERLYKLFRRGVTVPRSPAEVEVKSLALLSYGYPEVKFNVVCSGGTYVRTLCHDIGFFLGCGAYMSSLVRTRIGNFGTDESVPFTACVPGEKDIRPLNETLLSYPHFLVTERMAEGIKQGKQIVKSEILNMDSMLGKKYCGMFPVFDEKENLIALAETKSVSQESIRLLRVLQ